MKLICILLSVVIVVLLIRIIIYRRQIDSFAKQLHFHNENDSNVSMYSACNTREMRELRDELELLHQKLRARQLAYEDSEAKMAKMITDISHDIRTPLTSIMGYFQMMKESTDETKKEHYESVIENRLNAMSSMLEDFFDYTKISQKDKTKGMVDCNVSQILCEVLLSFYDDFGKQNVSPKIDIPEEEIRLLGEPSVYRRIFMNLTKNALVHGKDELVINLKNDTEEVKLYFENRTNEVLPDNLQEVFERFYKSDRARTDSTSTGLGLCIVKELVEGYGGEALVYSEKPGWFGICITFYKENKEM